MKVSAPFRVKVSRRSTGTVYGIFVHVLLCWTTGAAERRTRHAAWKWIPDMHLYERSDSKELSRYRQRRR